MTKRKLTFFSDAGHGWLSVATKDLVTLGIEDKISSFSYISNTRAFLEEDCDVTVFLDAAKAQGWEVTIKESKDCPDRSFIRGLACYTAERARNPIKVGVRVFLSNTESYKVTVRRGNHFILGKNLYRVPASNPFAYINVT
jgi:hypothetical protein